MTVEKCAVACGKFAYFGVEYGRECYCADTMHLGSLVAGEEECSFPCPGNSGQTCGAGNVSAVGLLHLDSLLQKARPLPIQESQ